MVAVIDHMKNGLDDFSDLIRFGVSAFHPHGHNFHADIAFLQRFPVQYPGTPGALGIVPFK